MSARYPRLEALQHLLQIRWSLRETIEQEAGTHITGYQANLSPKSLGFGVTAFVSIMMDSHTKDMALAFEQRLMEIPEIVACHNISGRYDFLLEILARDLESLPARCKGAMSFCSKAAQNRSKR
ncbi:Lrp/AsnC family transcriptional regulator [Pseudomonas sp. FYR_11]|uniref:Lrp/AsnC family transcriptional regulator n=1 Tax=Pseudomonas TaxID=286 RepID=UPI00370A9A03